MGGVIISIFEVVQHPTFALVYTIIQNFVVHMLMLSILFAWKDIDISLRKTISCALCGVVIGIIPIVVTNWIFPDPLVARLWIYRLFVYLDPISSLAYYAIMKRMLKFSATRATFLMHRQLLLHYVITTFLFLLNDVFSRVLHLQPAPEVFFPPDYLSLLILVGLWYSLLFIMKRRLKKSRGYLTIPPSYTDHDVKKNTMIMFGSVCIIYVVTVIFRVSCYLEVVNPINLKTGLIYFLFIISLTFYIFNLTMRLRLRLMDWEMQAAGTYISSLLHVNQEFRAIKHDFYNLLQTYEGYLAIKDYAGLKKYHEELVHTTRKAGDFLSFIEVLRPRIAVYSLLEIMSEKAKHVGVTLSINLVCDITNVTLSDIDLCRVLSIVIDNAIEEAALSEGKQVNLSFEHKGRNSVVFAVSNSTKGKVDTSRIMEEGYTTKDNHTGIGLPTVHHILNSYEHCSLRINYHDNQFTVFLILNMHEERGNR